MRTTILLLLLGVSVSAGPKMKVDTVDVDTVGFGDETCDTIIVGLYDDILHTPTMLLHHWWVDSCNYLRIMYVDCRPAGYYISYITDTTYYLTEDQLRWLSVIPDGTYFRFAFLDSDSFTVRPLSEPETFNIRWSWPVDMTPPNDTGSVADTAFWATPDPIDALNARIDSVIKMLRDHWGAGRDSIIEKDLIEYPEPYKHKENK